MSKITRYNTAHTATVLSVREDDPSAQIKADEQKALQQADTQKLIDAAVEAQVAGLKAKNDELLKKMKEAQEKAKQFDGLDAPRLKEMMERLDKDEDAKLFAEGKSNVVIDKYTMRMREKYESDLKAERENTAAERARAENYRASVLDNQIRAVTSGLHKGAVEDALLHGRNLFTLDAKGNAVQMDSEGRPVLGKDGVTPFSPAEWIELQKELKPHWFPVGSTGSGSGGTLANGSGGGKSISRANFADLSPSAQAATVKAGIKIID